MNALRKGNMGREVPPSNDYGSAEMDDNEQDYMRRVHNQQMYPPQVQDRGEDDDYLGGQSDMDQVVEVIWAQIQVQYGISGNASVSQDLAALAMKSIMNELGSGPNGEGCGDTLAYEIEAQVKTHFTQQHAMTKQQLKEEVKKLVKEVE